VPAESFWKERFKKYSVYVAEEDKRIVGFTELDSTGHIDCFFVHHEWQRRGVGTRMLQRIVASAGRQEIRRLFAEVSITAVPFFLEKGFVIVRENEAVRRDVKLKQFAMETWLAG
jgi:putative acetyltransferase